MAALIDLDTPDSQLLPRPHLSRETLATMALLSEAVDVTGSNPDVCGTTGRTALETLSPSVALSNSSTMLSQLLTHTVAVDLEPAISTRSSDTVIADLKIGRYKRQKVHSSPPVVNAPSNNHLENVSSKSEANQVGGDEEEAEDVESEPEEEVFAPKKPRKISERKRIQNAAQESWFQSYQRQQAKAVSNIGSVDNESLSVKYLVRQTESQRIISSPREYQVELFERAKEENVIAVLDTGQPYIYLLESAVSY